MVDIEIKASHRSYPDATTFRIMYEPSPSSRPARYAASVSFTPLLCGGFVTKPSYWKTAVANLTEAEAEASAPSLFDLFEAAS